MAKAKDREKEGAPYLYCVREMRALSLVQEAGLKMGREGP